MTRFAYCRDGMMRHGRPTRQAWRAALSTQVDSQSVACTITMARQEHAHRVWLCGLYTLALLIVRAEAEANDESSEALAWRARQRRLRSKDQG